jgi:Mg2+ and Co2+ transporter CorA
MVKQIFSSSLEPIVWRTIPVLEFLLQTWENMAKLSKFFEIEGAIRKGIENIDKWYRKVNDTDAFFICLGTFIFSIGPYCSQKLLLSFRSKYQDHIC